jgi:hypothetical protein
MRPIFYISILFMLAGCGGGEITPTPTPDGIVDTQAELTTALREMEFVVQVGGPFRDFLFEEDGQLLLVNGQQVQVWEFATVEAADEARAFITGPNSPLSRLDFSAPPRFFQSGQMVVLFVDINRSVLTALTALLGNPFL